MDLTSRQRRPGDNKNPSPKILETFVHPPSGLWTPTLLQELYYGPDSVKLHLLSCLPSSGSKAFIITGNSLATRTPLVRSVEDLLGDKHAGTFSKISQHAPVAQLDEAESLVSSDESIDTVISIGGGSPIDSAKALSKRYSDRHGRFLHHITIPTTLSAAECTSIAGYTNEDGLKISINDPRVQPGSIIYDASFARHTPPSLFLSTGIRALDHALETLYHPSTVEVPTKQLALSAAGSLFTYLPRFKASSDLDPENAGQTAQDQEVITNLQLAAFASLGLLGLNLKGGLGLSHTLGYALGSPYGIPHGITSCLTLGHVVKLKADLAASSAEQLARALPFVGLARSSPSSDPSTAETRNRDDAHRLGDAVLALVKELGLTTTLTEKGVSRDEVGTVAKRATGQESGELFEKVKVLVESLY